MMLCEACSQGRHWDCGMQTWCECECDGPDGYYGLEPYEERSDEEEESASTHSLDCTCETCIQNHPGRMALELPETCKVCGSDLEWVDCWKCLGEGCIDESDIDPLEGDEFYPCDECHGEGGYLECPALPHEKESHGHPEPA